MRTLFAVAEGDKNGAGDTDGHGGCGNSDTQMNITCAEDTQKQSSGGEDGGDIAGDDHSNAGRDDNDEGNDGAGDNLGSEGGDNKEDNGNNGRDELEDSEDDSVDLALYEWLSNLEIWQIEHGLYSNLGKQGSLRKPAGYAQK